MKKKILCIVLVWFMALMSLPLSALAEDGQAAPETDGEAITEVSVKAEEKNEFELQPDGSYLEATVIGNLGVYFDRDDTKAQAVMDLVNIEREKNGMNPLILDQELLDAAMLRAVEINFNFSHTRPNGQSGMSASGKAFGENIAWGQTSPEEVMESWMNSSGHRENILNAGWNSIGIGKCDNGWVQLFGKDTGKEAVIGKPSKKRVDIPYLTYNNFLNEIFLSMPEDFNGVLDRGETVVPAVSHFRPMSGMSWSNLSLSPDSFIWESDNPSVAEVNPNGVITGKNSGKAVISGSILNHGQMLTATVEIAVNVTVKVILGDINADGAINIMDMLAVQDHILGKSALENNDYVAADVNRDGVINIIDMLAIQDDILGKEKINPYE